LIVVAISPILAQPWVGPPWVPAPNVQQDWMPWNWTDRFQANVENSRVNGANINVIFYGDSLVEGWPGNIWNSVWAPYGSVNYGIGGDGTQNVLWRIINGEVDNLTPRLIVLKIGTNNIGSSSEADIAQGITTIVQELRSRVPSASILLVGITPRSNAAVTATTDAINAIIAHNENLSTIRFLDMRNGFYAGNGQFFSELFSNPADPLHFTQAGYLRWEELMYPLFNQMWNSS